MRPPSLVRMKRTAGWPFSSVDGSAVRRSRPVTAEAREIRYQASPVSLLREPMLLPGIRTASGGKHAAMILQGLLLARIGPAQRLLDLKHRRGLHDFLDPRRIVHARKLDKNLVLPEAVLLNHRFAHAQLVNSIADGLDRLGDRAVL